MSKCTFRVEIPSCFSHGLPDERAVFFSLQLWEEETQAANLAGRPKI